MYSESEDIPIEIITALIALGRSGVPAVAASLLLRLEAHDAHRAIVRGREVWNRVNCYEPYGTMVSIAVRDRAGVERWRGEKAACREQRRLDEIARHEGAVARHTAKATRDLANAVRRGDCLAVRALLGRGANPKQALPGGSSLQALARSHAREKMAAMLQELGIS